MSTNIALKVSLGINSWADLLCIQPKHKNAIDEKNLCKLQQRRRRQEENKSTYFTVPGTVQRYRTYHYGSCIGEHSHWGCQSACVRVRVYLPCLAQPHSDPPKKPDPFDREASGVVSRSRYQDFCTEWEMRAHYCRSVDMRPKDPLQSSLVPSSALCSRILVVWMPPCTDTYL